ncbi:MerR family transcriptional regulator [Streptosporangium sp. NPDC023615]|uniref:MerR family transcriptional regulator n=1 Tax=Streptosporangium sp. NPDC023615 TaxID=3154794 RepID=UPI0034326FFB
MDEQRQVATDEEPGYGIGAVARRLGVPAPTLRTWNLRYGLGPSRRSPGGHRRYDARDLWRLEEMNRLIRSGVPAADAAREVLRIETVPEPPAEPGAERGPARGAGQGQGPEQGAGQGQRPGTGPAPGARPGSRPGPATGPAPGSTSGSTSGPPPASGRPSPERVPAPAGRPGVPALPTVAMLTRAAVALDSRTVHEWLVAALTRHGVSWTWERLVTPVFEAICRLQSESSAGVEVEHLFSDRLLASLIGLTERPSRPVNVRPVLLACAPDDQHSLPIYALAAALTTEHRVETRVLGSRTPYPALADAMRRLGPSVVFVWSQLPATGDPAPLSSLPATRPPSRIIAGGVGWREGLPASIPHVTSFEEAVTRVLAALD